jgi:hypothetical protein
MRDLGLYCCEAPADTPSLAVPLLSRVAPRAGLVILRQTFDRRSHLLILADAFEQHQDRTPTHGYAATHEAAMAAFAKNWRGK